jgi:hypothetical protein
MRQRMPLKLCSAASTARGGQHGRVYKEENAEQVLLQAVGLELDLEHAEQVLPSLSGSTCSTCST